MRESIADALRAHAADRERLPGDPPGLAAFAGLDDLLASINRGIALEGGVPSASVPEEERERRKEGVGSEEHVVLATRFGMDYGGEREEGGEEGEEREEVRGGTGRVRDEL